MVRMSVSFQNSHVEILTPKGDSISRQGLWEVISHESEAKWDPCSYERDPTMLPSPFPARGYNQKFWGQKDNLPGSGCHSDLGNPASKTMRNEFLFFINYPGYFVIAPWRDWQLGTQMASKNGSYYYFNFTRNLRSSNGLPWWLSDKEFTCPYRRRGFNLRVSEIAPREGNDNLLQYSCWEIPWTEESGGLQSMGSQK